MSRWVTTGSFPLSYVTCVANPGDSCEPIPIVCKRWGDAWDIVKHTNRTCKGPIFHDQFNSLLGTGVFNSDGSYHLNKHDIP
jgi:hypothetical protein